LGYWVLGNIHRYWIVLLIVIGDIFCCADTIQYQDSSQHRPHASERLFSSACVISRVRTITLTAAIVCLDTMLFIKHNHRHHHKVLGFFVVIAVLYTGIDIAIGYWYR